MSESRKYTLGEVAMGGILGAIIIPAMFVVMVPFLLWKCYVLSVLWGWFIVPYFHIPQPPIWALYGLMMVVGMFRDVDTEEKETKTDWKKLFMSLTVSPAIALGVGWLIHHYALHGR